jgi:hypothetical protein
LQSIAEASGIEALVAAMTAMEAHKTRVLVQQHACAVLRILAYNNDHDQLMKWRRAVSPRK